MIPRGEQKKAQTKEAIAKLFVPELDDGRY